MKLYDDRPKDEEPEEEQEQSTQDDRMFDPPWMWRTR